MPMPTRHNWSGQPWLFLTHGDLQIERLQALDEGRDLSSVEAEFTAIAELDLDEPASQQRAEALLEAVQDLPVVPDYAYVEPSDLAGIQAARPAPGYLPRPGLDHAALLDKALGAWAGRAAGCLLGKPVEGRRAWQIEKYLKTQNRWPLDRYFSLDIPEDIAKECGFNTSWRALYEEGINCMVEDDDTNYTATGLAICRQYGAGFTPDDVGRFWLGNLPILHVCTAERSAYRNLVAGLAPPESALFHNPYREWIGAQIRADFFGYVNPGQPERAADFAWRDASISHIRNGLYGEMWVAAMLAAAYVSDDLETVIRAGMAQIPAQCRLQEALEHMLGLHGSGATYEQAVADLRSRWDENSGHHWCHTVSNAELVAIALLWGEKDFGKTICYAVMPGFDTDCNGATAGSVLGLMLGGTALPQQWIAPLSDTLLTGVAGYYKVSLTQMARETMELIGALA